METPSAAPKQRSPWLYVLLGCGGLAGLICLGTMIVVGLGVKAVKDVNEGVTDPAERQKNALKQLGGLPEGYSVVASLSVFVMQTTFLTDGEVLSDGGFDLASGGHTFAYIRVMAQENNKKTKDFLRGKDTDASVLANTGINIDPSAIVKRGALAIDGRKFVYVATRGAMNNGEGKQGLNNAILFDCPGDTLHVGIWSQPDPDPSKTAEALDLAGTVADEAQLVRFLKPMNPCGR